MGQQLAREGVTLSRLCSSDSLYEFGLKIVTTQKSTVENLFFMVSKSIHARSSSDAILNVKVKNIYDLRMLSECIIVS